LYLETLLFLVLPNPFPTCINQKEKHPLSVGSLAGAEGILWDEVSADSPGFDASGFLSVFLL